MRHTYKNPAERGAFGGEEIVDQIGVSIKKDPTENIRCLQAFRVAVRFGLTPSTAALIAGLAFPALVSTEAHNG